MGRKSEVSLTSKMTRRKCRGKLSTSRIQKKTKQHERNKNKNIRKLFDKLRNDTNSLNEINNTVIEITDNTQEVNETPKHSINPIVIEDDDQIFINPPCNVQTPRSDINMCPIQCSTPKNKSVNNNHSNIVDFNEDIANSTREINNDSFLTIDLTTDGTLNASKPTTVIDLVNNTESFNSSISMSGDSDVTVINTRIKKKGNKGQIRNFVNGLEQMNSSERGKLFEIIAQKIFSGCDGPHSVNSLNSLRNGIRHPTDTVEDAYIKEVILRQTPSRNSIGSNIYNPEKDVKNKTGLRLIVIDGSNVAMQHTKGRVFSVKGLKICIDYFVRRGHVVKAFVPHFRCKSGKSTDGRLLDQLERQGLVVYTPSREIQGRLITSYDDRYIVQCAAEFDGVIVSGDNYRDLLAENQRWRNVIENRLLQFTWVGDMIMFPKDPLGRSGPTLEQFLRHPFPNEK